MKYYSTRSAASTKLPAANAGSSDIESSLSLFLLFSPPLSFSLNIARPIYRQQRKGSPRVSTERARADDKSGVTPATRAVSSVLSICIVSSMSLYRTNPRDASPRNTHAGHARGVYSQRSPIYGSHLGDFYPRTYTSLIQRRGTESRDSSKLASRINSPHFTLVSNNYN